MTLRVLVIDDDDLSREVLEVLLREDGYVVETASSGDAALHGMDKGARVPDVVLTDFQMPGISGVELARRLREVCGTATRVVGMSASRQPASETGVFDAFLHKPFSMEEFARALEGGARLVLQSGATEDESVAAPVLDDAIFTSFEAMLGGQPLTDLYRACLLDAGRQLAEMRTAAAAADDAAFRKSAHALKGSFGMLGAAELQEMCAVLESGISNTTLVTLEHFPVSIETLRRMLIARGVDLAPEAEDVPGGLTDGTAAERTDL